MGARKRSKKGGRRSRRRAARLPAAAAEVALSSRMRGNESKTGGGGKHSNTSSHSNVLPSSFVVRRGRLTSGARQLVRDMRRVMLPHCSERLREKRSSKLKDYLAAASIMGVTHLQLFSQTDAGLYYKLIRLPSGPTLSFRVVHYTLIHDIQRYHQQQHQQHKMKITRAPDARDFLHPPLLILSPQTKNNKQQTTSQRTLPKKEKEEALDPPHAAQTHCNTNICDRSSSNTSTSSSSGRVGGGKVGRGSSSNSSANNSTSSSTSSSGSTSTYRNPTEKENKIDATTKKGEDRKEDQDKEEKEEEEAKIGGKQKKIKKDQGGGPEHADTDTKRNEVEGLVATVVKSAFPPIDIRTVALQDCRRVVLFRRETGACCNNSTTASSECNSHQPSSMLLRYQLRQYAVVRNISAHGSTQITPGVRALVEAGGSRVTADRLLQQSFGISLQTENGGASSLLISCDNKNEMFHSDTSDRKCQLNTAATDAPASVSAKHTTGGGQGGGEGGGGLCIGKGSAKSVNIGKDAVFECGSVGGGGGRGGGGVVDEEEQEEKDVGDRNNNNEEEEEEEEETAERRKHSPNVKQRETIDGMSLLRRKRCRSFVDEVARRAGAGGKGTAAAVESDQKVKQGAEDYSGQQKSRLWRDICEATLAREHATAAETDDEEGLSFDVAPNRGTPVDGSVVGLPHDISAAARRNRVGVLLWSMAAAEAAGQQGGKLQQDSSSSHRCDDSVVLEEDARERRNIAMVNAYDVAGEKDQSPRAAHGEEVGVEEITADAVEEKEGGNGLQKRDTKMKMNISLVELGPRMHLELVKIEEAVCGGAVIFHNYFVKKFAEGVQVYQTSDTALPRECEKERVAVHTALEKKLQKKRRRRKDADDISRDNNAEDVSNDWRAANATSWKQARLPESETALLDDDHTRVHHSRCSGANGAAERESTPHDDHPAQRREACAALHSHFQWIVRLEIAGPFLRVSIRFRGYLLGNMALFRSEFRLEGAAEGRKSFYKRPAERLGTKRRSAFASHCFSGPEEAGGGERAEDQSEFSSEQNGESSTGVCNRYCKNSSVVLRKYEATARQQRG